MSYSGNLSITQPAANQIFQRDSRTGGLYGKGTGVVGLTLSASTQAGLLEYQLRDALNPMTVLAPWTRVATAVGPGPVSLSIPIPATMGWYLVDFRAEGDPGSVVSTSNRIGVGEVVAAAGQSIATDFWDTNASGDTTKLADLGVTVSPYCAAFASWNANTQPLGWAAPADGGLYPSSFAAEFLRLAVASAGVNVALVGYAYNGSPISTWLPGQSNYLALVATLTQGGAKFGTIFWCQGHQDAKAAGASTADYINSLRSIISTLAATFTFTFNRVLCSVPAIGNAASGRFDAGSIAAIRAAHLQYVTTDPTARYVGGLDAALAADGIHPSQAGNITLARHFYRAFNAEIGVNQNADDGPSIVRCARARGGAQVFLQVSPATSLNLVGDCTSQFQIFATGTTSVAFPVTSVSAASDGVLIINLSAVPLDSQPLDIYYRRPFDTSSAVTSGIYDNVVDADGIATGRQLRVSEGPITAAAPDWHRPMLASPGTPIYAAATVCAFIS